jgi:hypothetical protein
MAMAGSPTALVSVGLHLITATGISRPALASRL